MSASAVLSSAVACSSYTPVFCGQRTNQPTPCLCAQTMPTLSTLCAGAMGPVWLPTLPAQRGHCSASLFKPAIGPAMSPVVRLLAMGQEVSHCSSCSHCTLTISTDSQPSSKETIAPSRWLYIVYIHLLGFALWPCTNTSQHVLQVEYIASKADTLLPRRVFACVPNLIRQSRRPLINFQMCCFVRLLWCFARRTRQWPVAS